MSACVSGGCPLGVGGRLPPPCGSSRLGGAVKDEHSFEDIVFFLLFGRMSVANTSSLEPRQWLSATVQIGHRVTDGDQGHHRKDLGHVRLCHRLQSQERMQSPAQTAQAGNGQWIVKQPHAYRQPFQRIRDSDTRADFDKDIRLESRTEQSHRAMRTGARASGGASRLRRPPPPPPGSR